MFEDTGPRVDAKSIDRARSEVRRVRDFLDRHGIRLEGRRILEVGCHGGAHAHAIAESGAKAVLGIDVAEYGIRQRTANGDPEQQLSEQLTFLERLRADTARFFPVSEAVEFAFSDATKMEYETEFDLIVSWETLEHVVPPDLAIENMHRALRPGGYCLHEYNPFFCFSGGHSLCTLDFPYGHVLLSSQNFEDYVRTYRPDELRAATAFFNESLNRMTLHDLQTICASKGFEVTALVPSVDWKPMRWIDADLLAIARARYPTLQILDLLSDRVTVLLRKR